MARSCRTNLPALYADHGLEDIIEKIGVQFYAKYIRGRPLPPAWHPGWPLYVCDQRYIPSEHAFIRIKNWLHLIPEEFRSSQGQNWMPTELFDPYGVGQAQRTIHPRRMKSPFLKGVKGPGHIGEEGTPSAQSLAEGPVEATRASSFVTSNVAPTKVAFSASPVAEPPRAKRHYTKRGTGEIARRKAREAEEAKAEADAAAATRPSTIPFQQVRPTYLPPPTVHHHKRKIDDRSVSAAAGGPAYVRDARIDVLPSETGTLA